MKAARGCAASLGRLYILARSAEDVRAVLVARFGETTVLAWEAPGENIHDRMHRLRAETLARQS